MSEKRQQIPLKEKQKYVTLIKQGTNLDGICNYDPVGWISINSWSLFIWDRIAQTLNRMAFGAAFFSIFLFACIFFHKEILKFFDGNITYSIAVGKHSFEIEKYERNICASLFHTVLLSFRHNRDINKSRLLLFYRREWIAKANRKRLFRIQHMKAE